MTDRRQLGNSVRRLRNAAGLSQHELAAKLRLTRSSIANIEAGRQSPNLDSLAELAAALGTTVAGFLGEDQGDQQSVSTALLSKVAGQQRALTNTVAELASLLRQLAEQSERMEQLLTEHGISA